MMIGVSAARAHGTWGRIDLPPRLKGRRRDERAIRRSNTPHLGPGMGRDRIPPAGTPAEVGRLGSSLQRGAARAAERIVAVDSPLYAGIPGQTATRTAPAAAEDGPAPVGYHVDVLESLEERVGPSRTTQVTRLSCSDPLCASQWTVGMAAGLAMYGEPR